MAKAPGCPTFLQSKGESGSKGSAMAKVLSLSLSLSFSFFFLLFALGYGFRMQGRRRRQRGMKSNGQVSPNNPFLFILFHHDGRSHSHGPNLPH